MGRGEAAVAHYGVIFFCRPLFLFHRDQSLGAGITCQKNADVTQWSPTTLERSCFGASGMRWKEVESRRPERATEATGLRTEAGSYMQQGQASVQWIRGRRLRCLWAQSPPKVEVGQRPLATCLGDRTRAPSKKDSFAETPQQSPRAAPDRDAGPIAGISWQVPSPRKPR